MISTARGAGLLNLSVTIGMLAAPMSAAAAAKVERVVSPGGIEAYLLSEPSIPFLSLSLQFRGGAALDPKDKEGLAYMVSGLLDEGAGDLDSQAFRIARSGCRLRPAGTTSRAGSRRSPSTASAPSSCSGWR
jgi:zinc protease